LPKSGKSKEKAGKSGEIPEISCYFSAKNFEKSPAGSAPDSRWQ